MPSTLEKIIALTNKQGMTIMLSNWGATWLSCTLPVQNKIREVVLGCATLSQYKKQQAYLGATIGRYANRIRHALIYHQNKHYQLSANQGVHHLHGGVFGFDKQRWQIHAQTTQQVTFGFRSPDGDQGFPGELNTTVSYHLTDNNQVIITFNATTTQLTPVNLTNHAYFNLDGDDDKHHDARKQSLQINANYYLPVDANGLPYAGLMSVSEHDMDFRQVKKLSTRFLESKERQCVGGYDHAYLLDKNHSMAAQLISSDKKVTMTVMTTKPALQIYTANFLQGTPNRKNGKYQQFAGIALEAQFLPDSPNHPEWCQPSCWLSPDQTYHHQTSYQFMIN